jgi:hypothetical protein
LSATDETLGEDRTWPILNCRRTRGKTTRDAEQRFQHRQKVEPAADWLHAAGASDRPIADLWKAKRKGPATIQDGDRATTVPSLFSEAYFSVQTFMDFMPVSASVLVLNIPLSTTVVVVVVGFLSTTVHFLVEASRTT